MTNTPAELELDGRDIPVEQLQILNKRENFTPSLKGFQKIVASIRAIGLIEPLSVFPENGGYVLLDGFLRLMAFKELGMPTVPCVVYKDKQAYTFNRNVNRLSPYQEIRMLRKSLETVDEATIAQTFGMKTIRSRLIPHLVRQLHPEAVAAFKANIIGKAVANELMLVTQDRQVEILREMRKMGDYNSTFCRALVIQTPAEQRNKQRKGHTSWADDHARKNDMMSRLAHAEQQHDFFAQLYRQYSSDLLKAAFYVRKMISTPEIEKHLEVHYPEILARFRSVIEDAA